MTSPKPRIFSHRSLWLLLFLLATAALFWLLMMSTHELGHVIGAALTGGHVVKVVLSPLAFSRTDVTPNPFPAFVTWSGPFLGALVPTLAWSLSRLGRSHGTRWLQAFAGFCLLANGAYLASALAVSVGDTFDLINLGISRWTLAGVGVPATAAGLLLWHNLGPRFATLTLSDTELRGAAVWSGVTLVSIIAMMSLFASR